MQTDSLSVRPPAADPAPDVAPPASFTTAAELHVAPEPTEPHSPRAADPLAAPESERPLAALALLSHRIATGARTGIAALARRAAAIRLNTPAQTSRFAAGAAVIALAAGIGAAAGAAGASRWGGTTTVAAPASHHVPTDVKSLKDAIAQIRASIRALSDNVASLRAHVDAANKTAAGASAKLGEQIGKLHEQVARLQEAGAPRPATATGPQHLPTTLDRAAAALERAGASPATDVTGSIPNPAPRPPKAEAGSRPPNILEGWSLRRVYDGFALIEGRYGAIEVEPGDLIRGVGRVTNIRRQDGRWVVETTRGLIVAR